MYLSQCLADEQQALQMAYVSMESVVRRLQEDNQELVARWMQLKAKDADRMNQENEKFVKAKEEKVKEELRKAADEPVFVDIPGRSVFMLRGC